MHNVDEWHIEPPIRAVGTEFSAPLGLDGHDGAHGVHVRVPYG